MKHVLLMVVMFMVFSMLSAQTQVYTENFETIPISLTSTTTDNVGGTSWGSNTRIFSEGAQCDSVFVTQGDTTFLTMNGSFSTMGLSHVYLNFDHICKVAYADSAIIEISNDNGTTWRKIKGGHYLGSSQFNNLGFRFNEFSYGNFWDLSNHSALPQQSWWKNEFFDISSLASYSAQVKIRFALIDGNNIGAAGRSGWYLDNIIVNAAISELIPPTVSLLSPVIRDTVYTSIPVNVSASITDGSGIDTALCIIQILPNNIFDTIPMVLDASTTSTYRCSIPFYGFGRTTKYYVIAWDETASSNVDSTATYKYIAKNSPGGTAEIGDPASPDNTIYPFNTNFQDSKAQYIYTAAEMNAAGVYGGLVSSISLEVVSIAPGSPALNNFTIKIKNTSSSTLTAFDQSGLTTVYSPASYTVQSVGWNTFEFTSPFNWDGISNISIQYCFDNTNWYTSSDVRHTSAPGMGWIQYSEVISGCSMSAGEVNSLRPNIRFEISSASKLKKDIGVAHIINPNSGMLIGTSYDIIVDLKNFGVDTITSAQINWSLDGIAQTPYIFGTPTDSIFPSGIKAPITLGTETATAGTHYIIAWTDLPNGALDSDIMNDTTTFYFYGCSSALAGNYTIGGITPNFPTFKDAALALNQCGISAPVTFNVRAGTYNEQVSIKSIVGTSSTNTVVFQSETGDSTSVILEYDAIGAGDDYVLKLKGTSNIGFNSMTIQALDSFNARVIVLDDYVSGLTLTNNIIQTTVIPTSSDENMALVFCKDTVGSNIIITNNVLTNSINAITLEAGTVKASNWVISNNIITGHYSSAIKLTNSFSAQVIANTIMPDTAAATTSYNGIVLIGATGSAVITKNKISSAKTKIAYGILFRTSTFNPLNHTLVANNIIDMHVLSTENTLSAGIYVNETSSIDVFNNSINLKGNHSYSSNITLYDEGATAGTTFNINIVNNNLVNIASGYLYFIEFVDTSLWTNSNNNCFNNYAGSGFAYLEGEVADLATWQTISGAENTVSIDPYFGSLSDLKTHNNVLNNIGIPHASVTHDINGIIRNTVTPDIGAYEFNAEPWDIMAIEVLAPNGSCGMSTAETVIVRYRNIGASDISGGFNACYQLKGSSTIVTEAVTATILSGDTLDFQFATTVNLDISGNNSDSIFVIKAWGDLNNDFVAVNDSIIEDIVSAFVPAAPITTGASVNYANSTVITATSPDSLIWFATNDASIAELAITNNYNTGILYDTTTYWVGAGGALPAIKLTETVQSKSATGATSPYPSYFPSQDFIGVEISNLGSGLVDLSGYTINTRSFATSSYTFPEGTKILSGEVLIALSYQGVVPGPMSNNVFYIPHLFVASSSSIAYWLTDPSGAVIDAFASNGASFPSGSGVTASDFSGSLTGTGGHQGAVRETSDNNQATDWAVVVPGMPSFGSFNSQLTINKGSTCISLLTALQVDVLAYSSIDAGITQVVSPVGDLAGNTPHDLKIDIKNYGTSTINSLDINYTINGVDTITYNWSGSLSHQQNDTVNIGVIDLIPGLYDLYVWTSNPNGLNDTINTNDTTMVSYKLRMNGTYTIGDTANGAVFDYPNFTDAVHVLNTVGVCDPVEFVVDTGSYNEQITINVIDGASAINTVTFNSVNSINTEVTVHFLLTYDDNYLIKFNGADYVTFKNMSLESDAPDSFGRIFVFIESSEHITIKNNVIDAGVGTYNSSAGVFSNDSKGNYNTIIDNHFVKGFNSIFIKGSIVENTEVGHIIENNILDNFIGGAIDLENMDSIRIINNELKSVEIGNVNQAQYFGMNIKSCKNNVVIKNNNILLKASGETVGINIDLLKSSAANKSIIANNTVKIYNGLLTNIGMKINNSFHIDLVYNSLDVRNGDVNSTAIYLDIFNLNGGVNIINNLFIDSNSYAAIIKPEGIAIMDYNSFYSNSDSIIKYNNVGLTSLINYKIASSKDANSVNINPKFSAFDDMHYANSYMAGLGTPIADVTVDMDGDIRNITRPTIGADEKDMAQYDIGIVKIINISDTISEGVFSTPMVIIRNYGYDSISSGFIINYAVNNGAIVSYNYTDTLLSAAIDTVTLVDFAATASNSQFCATTVLAVDTSTYNDTRCYSFYGFPIRDALLVDIAPIEEICDMTYDTVKVLVTNIGVDTINGSGQTNNTISYQSNASTIVNEPFISVVAPLDSVWYEFTTLTYVGANSQADSLYSIRAWINFENDSYVGNDSITMLVNSPHTPDIPVFTSPLSIVYATQAVLNATSTSNDSVIWYIDNTIAEHEYVGNQYITNGYITQDTSMWLSSQIFAPNNTTPLGTHNDVNNAVEYPTTFGSFYLGNKEQYLVTASELTNIGVTAGPITQVEFEVAVMNACPALSDFNVSIGHSMKTEMTSWENGLTPVYNSSSYTPHLGWNTFDFATPFVWDGSSNIVIEICSNNTSFTDLGNASVKRSNTSFISTLNKHDDLADVCAMNTVSDSYSSRPNLKLKATSGGCASPRVEFLVQVQPQSSCDVSALDTVGLYSQVYMTNNEILKVEVMNFGTSDQTTVPVSYTINGGTPVTENVSVLSNVSTVHTFAVAADFSNLGTYDVKFYTALSCDNVYANDTLSVVVEHLIPNYCNSTATENSGSNIKRLYVGIDSNISTSNSTKYTDYTSIGSLTTIAPGNSYPISIDISAAGTAESGYVKVYIDYNRDGSFDPVNEYVFGDAYTGASSSNIVTIAGNLSVPANTITGTTHMRVVCKKGGNTTNVDPCGSYTRGETEDYIISIAPYIAQDAGIEQLLNISPLVISNILPLKVRVRNYGFDPITSVDLVYDINGLQSTFTYSTTIAVGDSADVLIGNVYIADGANTICVHTVLTGDDNFLNDQACANTFRESVEQLAYADDFEGTDLWRKADNANQWQRGVPTMTNINTAHSPVNVWAIGLDTNYKNNSFDILYSPKFEIAPSIDSAKLKFWHFYQTQVNKDGGYIEYRKNSTNWASLGYLSDQRATAWYTDNIGGIYKWTGNSAGWIESTYNFDFTSGEFEFTGTSDTIQFRYIFSSDATFNDSNGWAVDDFSFELPPVAKDVGVIAITSPSGSAQIGATINVTIDVKNMGTAAQTTIPVFYSIANSTLVNETFTPTGGLAPNATASYTFAITTNALGSDFQLCAGTDLVGDSYPQNNEMCTNITVTPANIDGGVTATGISQDYVINGDTTLITNPITVLVEVKNFGLTTLTTFPVKYSINGGANWTTETWSGTLASNEVDTFKFVTTYNSALGGYNLCAITSVPGDANADNDKTCDPYVGVVSVEGAIENAFEVSQNEPNPAHGNVLISYIVPNNGDVEFELRNTLGQVIYTTNQESYIGNNTIEVDAKDLANGVYYYSVTFDGKRITRKMIVNQ